jgi:hypothetical protein
MKLEFCRQTLEKNTQISNLMKIRPVGAELLHTDGRTDMTKQIVAFRNFANAPKNSKEMQQLEGRKWQYNIKTNLNEIAREAVI